MKEGLQRTGDKMYPKVTELIRDFSLIYKSGYISLLAVRIFAMCIRIIDLGTADRRHSSGQ